MATHFLDGDDEDRDAEKLAGLGLCVLYPCDRLMRGL